MKKYVGKLKSSEIWIPQKGEGIYFIDSFGMIDYTPNSGNTKDDYNKFKNQEEATIIKRGLTLYMAMMRYKFDNDNVFSSTNFNYIIDFERAMAVPIVGNNPTIVSFSSQEKAEGCINFLIKEGLIERHFIVGS